MAIAAGEHPRCLGDSTDDTIDSRPELTFNDMSFLSMSTFGVLQGKTPHTEVSLR